MAEKILVEVSARHIHLKQEDMEILFGKGHTLTKIKDLSQPGEFSTEERVTVVGPKRELANVSILGPTRVATQVELSATDARSLGIVAPVRESGDVTDSGACKLIGPAGEIELADGVIVAKRHVHFTPEDAQKFGVSNKDILWVRINTHERSLIFGDVVARVSETYSTAMHIDTDEGNAVGIPKEPTYCEICLNI